MSAPWECDLCGGGDGEYAGRVCDCVTITRMEFDAMAKEWRSARTTIEHVADERGGSIGANEFAMLDDILIGGECQADPSAVPLVVRGEDSCR